MLSVGQILAEKKLGDFLTLHEDVLPLAEGALLLDLDAHPTLDVAMHHELFQEMSEEVRRLGLNPADPFEAVRLLNHFLFTLKRFTPNQQDYYDPRNSRLSQVLLRRTGIPVTLSLIYIELAHRVGLDVYGVGLPGHFMVGFRCENDPYFVDTFRQGEVLSHHRCQDFFHDLHGGRVRLHEEYLTRVDNRSILVRILQNLKILHLQRHDTGAALCALNRILQLTPDAWQLRRERAMLCLKHEFHARALLDLQMIATSHPDEAGEFKAVMKGLERKLLWKN